MSLEDNYDAWVRGLMGGGKYAATPRQTAEASEAVQQMQAQLDAPDRRPKAAECRRERAGRCAEGGCRHGRERAQDEQ